MIDAYQNILIEPLQSNAFNSKNVSVMVARLDQIHPVVSGNKLFKLHYFIESAKARKISTVVTLGGAYSNHLAATAFYCQQQNIRSIGIVRGEAPAELSHTLNNCKHCGMQLIFVSRMDYPNINEANANQFIDPSETSFVFIPEGGFDTLGAKGAAHIADILFEHQPSHICTAIGTATTFAGLLSNKKNTFKTIGIPALKGMKDVAERLDALLGKQKNEHYEIWDSFHFGGYAKFNQKLLDRLLKILNIFQDQQLKKTVTGSFLCHHRFLKYNFSF
jgi:1-aminocyclopropane-1-carboxylate deaminase